MQRLLLIITCLLPLGLTAQVEVKLIPSQDTYLVGEELKIGVQISNFTGRTLKLGHLPEWIRFGVEPVDGGVINRLANVEDSGEFQLGTSHRGTLRYDIQPLFDLTRAGRYRVTAAVRVDAETEVISDVAHFDITNGSRIWDREFGVSADDGQSTVERRRYIIQQANYHRSIQLYLRITDPSENQTYKVVSLGRMVNSTRPQFAVDKKSHLHILHQSGIDNFPYHVINYKGEILTRQTHAYVDRRPELRANPSGEIAVIGGERRFTPMDIPQRPNRLTAAPPREDAK